MSFGTRRYIDLLSLTGLMDSVTFYQASAIRVKRLLGIVLMSPKHQLYGDRALSSQRGTIDRNASGEIWVRSGHGDPAPDLGV